jgi:hypothetical protein
MERQTTPTNGDADERRERNDCDDARDERNDSSPDGCGLPKEISELRVVGRE